MSKKKPATLKIISGTVRKDRKQKESLDIPKIKEIPDAPTWLPNAFAVQEYERLAALLKNLGLLTEGNINSLCHLCALHGKMVQLYNAGETPPMSMVAQYRNLTLDFGLPPIAQGKIKPSVKPPEDNPFARNGTKPG